MTEDDEQLFAFPLTASRRGRMQELLRRDHAMWDGPPAERARLRAEQERRDARERAIEARLVLLRADVDRAIEHGEAFAAKLTLEQRNAARKHCRRAMEAVHDLAIVRVRRAGANVKLPTDVVVDTAPALGALCLLAEMAIDQFAAAAPVRESLRERMAATPATRPGLDAGVSPGTDATTATAMAIVNAGRRARNENPDGSAVLRFPQNPSSRGRR